MCELQYYVQLSSSYFQLFSRSAILRRSLLLIPLVCCPSVIILSLLLPRFSDAGDCIFATDANGDSELCRIALKEGRTLVALVPDVGELDTVTESLSIACMTSAKTGLWHKMLYSRKATVMVGKNVLPLNVPPHNLPLSVSEELQTRGGGPAAAKILATASAAARGLEIKVKTALLADCGSSRLYSSDVPSRQVVTRS